MLAVNFDLKKTQRNNHLLEVIGLMLGIPLNSIFKDHNVFCITLTLTF